VRTAIFLAEHTATEEEIRRLGAGAPSADGARRAANRLRGVVSEAALPGFEAEPLTIATLEDGSKRILDHRLPGHARVAGTLEGPFGALETLGAIGVAGPVRATVFSLRTG
jgi:hypothetical protein